MNDDIKIEQEDKELFSKTKKELKDMWYFSFENNNHDSEIMLNDFYDNLKLYESKCFKWEIHHNGAVDIVRRIRDMYILPKIRMFLKYNTIIPK